MLRLHSAWDRALVALFLAVIMAPGLATLAGVDQGSTRGENRELAPPPRLGLDWVTLGALPDGAARYFEDHFAFRARLVQAQAAVRLSVLRVSPSPDVLVGREGWFFYTADGAAEDMASATPFTAEELETWRITLQHTHDWLRSRGTSYLFVVAPDKHAIYPEYLPASIHPVRLASRIDELVRYLHDHSDVPVLDLRPALLETKHVERLYHRTDTHWNDRGAFVAYTQIMRRLGLSKPISALPRSAFEPLQVRTPGMDLAGMLGLTEWMQEDDLTLRSRRPPMWRVVEPPHPEPHGIEARLVTDHDDSTRPRAIVFRDSFGSALIPFLSEHFSRALYLWQYNMDPAVVIEEHPDVVLQEWVGRRVTMLLPYDGVAALAR